ncbi:hypothetical protein [Streptomyces sp. NPDC056290]|uniref:hypothetical protein n=1 Tax=unclassified Streptomyces TaxID=2593676 RepID=UPI0035DD6D60
MAGYRHPRNAGRPGMAAAVAEAFTQPRPLIEAMAAGDPIVVLPAVIHALGHGQLTPVWTRRCANASSSAR